MRGVVLKCFKNAVQYSPKTLATDGSCSIIIAARRTVPRPNILLDAWHLDHNQSRHVSAYQRSLGLACLIKDILSHLYAMHNSSTKDTFKEQRVAFEWKYFRYAEGLGEEVSATPSAIRTTVDEGEEGTREVHVTNASNTNVDSADACEGSTSQNPSSRGGLAVACDGLAIPSPPTA